MKINITIEGNPFGNFRKHMNVWFDSRTRNVMVKVLSVAVLIFTCFLACRALYFYGYPFASLVLSILCIGVVLYKGIKGVTLSELTRYKLLNVMEVVSLLVACSFACAALYPIYPEISMVIGFTVFVAVVAHAYFKMVSADKGAVSPTEDKCTDTVSPENDKAWRDL